MKGLINKYRKSNYKMDYYYGKNKSIKRSLKKKVMNILKKEFTIF